MLEIFNNREIALGIWILISAALVTLYRPLRDIVTALVRLLFRRYLFVPLMCSFFYIAAFVLALAWLGVWDVSQLKNTVLWSLGVGLIAVLRINEILEDKDFFIDSLKDQFKIVTVFEFVVLFYTFPLWAELIIIPVATILVVLQGLSQKKPDLRPLSSLVDGMLVWLGVGLVGITAYRLLFDFDTFWQASTVSAFALPIVLSLGFLPFLYVLITYWRYQLAFISLNSAFKDDVLRRSAKRISVTGFLGRPQLLRRWIRDIHTQRPATREEVLAVVKRVKAVAEKEKKPPPVDSSQGWCPFAAGKFLSGADLETGDYHPDVIPGQWIANSKYLKVSDAVLGSSISYYVSGDEHAAKELELTACFEKTDEFEDMRVKLGEVAVELAKKALGSMPSPALGPLVQSLKPFEIECAGRGISLKREDWGNGRGFDVRFFIRAQAGL